MRHRAFVTALASGGLVAATLLAPAAVTSSASGATAAAGKVSCASARLMCTEVADSESAFGEDVYVGHDEPSLLFYSNRAGSGNRMRYEVTIPKDPAGPFSTAKSYNAMLRPTFWFGMALCDTQSYPEQVATCAPDTDANIVDPAVSPNHPGTAFMELQFYPPGYVQQFDGFSCDATKWCAALTIDSLGQDPVNNTVLNPSCRARVLGGVEPVNFAYLTRNGRPQGPPDPLNFDPVASGRPGPGVLYFNQGDRVVVTLRDTSRGLLTEVRDESTGQRGSMTASAANGFAQIKYAPTGTECTALPYDFHPMYATSSPATRVPWAAHSYNVAFSDEIGHFDWCASVDPATGSCAGLEGPDGDQEPADADDNACFTPAQSTRLPLTGCLDSNIGFDGASYQPIWPDGSRLHPTAALFSSPLTGRDFRTAYSQAAFEADLPRVEPTCNRTTGAGCTLIPQTDDGTPAAFYPYFSSVRSRDDCVWGIGSTLPRTQSDFGRNAQYGPLLSLTYTAGAGTVQRFNDFRNVLPDNPCAAHH